MSHIPPEELKDLFYEMLRIRRLEQAIAERYPEEEMRCPTHLSIGQEAIPVGVSSVLEDRDYVLSNHRSHAHYLAKGGDALALVAELYGRESGCTGGRGGSMHLMDLDAGFLGAVPIVSATIPISVGSALRSAKRGEDRVTVIYLGEGATEEGAFHESMNAAQLHDLPLVFVCENNKYSVYSPMDVRQPEERDNVALARGYGIESYRGDGNDVEEVRQLATIAVERARNGDGPTFLELETYRWREHCGPYFDNDLGYRTEEEFQDWKARCPIRQTKRRLKARVGFDEKRIERIEMEIQQDIENLFRAAQEAPWPDPQDATKKVYRDPLGHEATLPGDL